MANLWRTQRPRFPQYVSDGSGRDYYIKYNNAGYWENQFNIQKKVEYDYPKYNNFHSLFHQAARVKYIPTGNGRETYIINEDGQIRDQKSLASYKLDDFLREKKSLDISIISSDKKRYRSLEQKKNNNQLKLLEKRLINRLYKIPERYKEKKDEVILPVIENREIGKNDDNKYNNENSYSGEQRLNTLDSIPSYDSKNLRLNYFNNNNRKLNKITLKKNFDTIIRQSQNLERYELNNHSRRSDNENDYYIYKKGRIGCRLNLLKSIVENSLTKSENTLKRMNTEGNYSRNLDFPIEKSNKMLKKNKLTFIDPNSEDKKFNTID